MQKARYWGLSEVQISVHVLYAVLAALCISAAARPHNAYVGLRMGCAVYVLVAVANLAYAYMRGGRWYWAVVIGEFVLLNQWATWALIHQYGGNTTAIASFIAKITWGWVVATVVARLILPVAA